MVLLALQINQLLAPLGTLSPLFLPVIIKVEPLPDGAPAFVFNPASGARANAALAQPSATASLGTPTVNQAALATPVVAQAALSTPTVAQVALATPTVTKAALATPTVTQAALASPS